MLVRRSSHSSKCNAAKAYVIASPFWPPFAHELLWWLIFKILQLSLFSAPLSVLRSQWFHVHVHRSIRKALAASFYALIIGWENEDRATRRAVRWNQFATWAAAPCATWLPRNSRTIIISSLRSAVTFNLASENQRWNARLCRCRSIDCCGRKSS